MATGRHTSTHTLQQQPSPSDSSAGDALGRPRMQAVLAPSVHAGCVQQLAGALAEFPRPQALSEARKVGGPALPCFLLGVRTEQFTIVRCIAHRKSIFEPSYPDYKQISSSTQAKNSYHTVSRPLISTKVTLPKTPPRKSTLNPLRDFLREPDCVRRAAAGCPAALNPCHCPRAE